VHDQAAIRAVLPGVSTGFIPASALDTPISYEALAAIDGLGLGAVFDDTDDLVAATAGAPFPLGRVVRPVHGLQARRPESQIC
jgi:NADH:ubiquinone oxidoreductase subunit F (NADH-binding)